MSLENEIASSSPADQALPQQNGVAEVEMPAEAKSVASDVALTNGITTASSVNGDNVDQPFSTPPSTPQQQEQLLQSGTNASAQLALQRTLEILKGAEVDTSVEEMRKLDSQIDHFNSYLDKFEAKNNELNQRLNELLETQKGERERRRASFQQRETENREQAQELEVQMQALLNRCHASRRVTVADIGVTENGNEEA